jgi:nicotinamidase-related amidase
MAITTLDPVTALVVIDLQKGIAGIPCAHPLAEILAKAVALTKAFRTRGLPVALVNVAGAPAGRTDSKRPPFNPPANFLELLPELDQQPSDIVVTKYTRGAFHGTSLDMLLRRRGVTQVVIAGIATSSGVESTANAAYEHGYNVTLAIDAMTDPSLEAHNHSIERAFPKLGESGTTAEILAKLSNA